MCDFVPTLMMSGDWMKRDEPGHQSCPLSWDLEDILQPCMSGDWMKQDVSGHQSCPLSWDLEEILQPCFWVRYLFSLVFLFLSVPRSRKQHSREVTWLVSGRLLHNRL